MCIGLLRFSVWGSLYNSWSEGFKGNMKGDGTLLGSSLVIDKGENPAILYQYRSQEFGDRAPPQEILEAAQKIKKDD